MEKIIVAYLTSGFVNIKFLKRFLINFKKFNPGHPHELIICFKKLNKSEKNKRYKLIRKIKFFDDKEEKNDHEWGTLKRLCKVNQNRTIFWMNDHSFPVCNNWLKEIMKHNRKNRFLGTSGSYSSHYSNSFYRNKNDNYFKAIIKIIYFFFNVAKFSNKHIRITGFLIKSKDFIEYMRDKKIKNKLQSFLIESGYKSLTNFFKKKKYDIFVVNRNGDKFNLHNMKESLTFAYSKQNKFLISDNQIREYLKHSNEKMLKRSNQVWDKKF